MGEACLAAGVLFWREALRRPEGGRADDAVGALLGAVRPAGDADTNDLCSTGVGIG
jgi:hypothetical protein